MGMPATRLGGPISATRARPVRIATSAQRPRRRGERQDPRQHDLPRGAVPHRRRQLLLQANELRLRDGCAGTTRRGRSSASSTRSANRSRGAVARTTAARRASSRCLSAFDLRTILAADMSARHEQVDHHRARHYARSNRDEYLGTMASFRRCTSTPSLFSRTPGRATTRSAAARSQEQHARALHLLSLAAADDGAAAVLGVKAGARKREARAPTCRAWRCTRTTSRASTATSGRENEVDQPVPRGQAARRQPVRQRRRSGYVKGATGTAPRAASTRRAAQVLHVHSPAVHGVPAKNGFNATPVLLFNHEQVLSGAQVNASRSRQDRLTAPARGEHVASPRDVPNHRAREWPLARASSFSSSATRHSTQAEEAAVVPRPAVGEHGALRWSTTPRSAFSSTTEAEGSKPHRRHRDASEQSREKRRSRSAAGGSEKRTVTRAHRRPAPSTSAAHTSVYDALRTASSPASSSSWCTR